MITLKNITKTYGGAAQVQALKGINQDQAAQINRLLSNPQALEQLLNTPRAKQLLNELMGGK